MKISILFLRLLLGIWYEVATNEPTIPKFCDDCQSLNWTITSDTAFSDTFQASCESRKLPFSLPLKGTLSSDPAAPGNQREMGVPNMIFNVTRGADGALATARVYSCVNSVLGLFSWQLLSRSPYMPISEIEEAIAEGKRMELLRPQFTIWFLTNTTMIYYDYYYYC